MWNNERAKKCHCYETCRELSNCQCKPLRSEEQKGKEKKERVVSGRINLQRLLKYVKPESQDLKE